MTISDLNVVMILFGDYENCALVDWCIHENRKRLAGAKFSFYNLNDLHQLAPKYRQLRYALDRNMCIYYGDEIRIDLINSQDHTLYLDCDSIVCPDLINEILTNPQQSLIGGWTDENGDWEACSGIFAYHGEGKCNAFSKITQLYESVDEDALKNPDWAFYKKFLNKETSILEGDCHIKYFLDMTHLGLSKIFFLLKSDCKKIYYSYSKDALAKAPNDGALILLDAWLPWDSVNEREVLGLVSRVHIPSEAFEATIKMNASNILDIQKLI